MLKRLDHIAIAVEDLERAQREMIALLGRSPAWQGGHPEQGVRNVIFRLDNTWIELRAPAAEGPAGDALRAELDARGEGLLSFALATDDLESTAKTLRERGLEVGEIAIGLSQDGPSGAWRRFRTARLAPDACGGIAIDLIQQLSMPEEMPPSLALSGEASAVGALDHIVIFTNDADRAVELYRDRLEIRLALDRSFEERNTRILFFRIGGATIEIGASLEPEEGPDRLWGLAYQTPEIEAAHARLEEAGVEVSAVRTGRKPGTRVCTVKSGTCGVPTLLIEPSSNSA